MWKVQSVMKDASVRESEFSCNGNKSEEDP